MSVKFAEFIRGFEHQHIVIYFVCSSFWFTAKWPLFS